MSAAKWVESARGSLIPGISFIAKGISKRHGRPLGKLTVLKTRCRGAVDRLRVPVKPLRTVVVAAASETETVCGAPVGRVDCRLHMVVSLLHGTGRLRTVEPRPLRAPRVLLSIAGVIPTATIASLAPVKACKGPPAAVSKAPIGHCRTVREVGCVIEEDSLSQPAKAPAQQPKGGLAEGCHGKAGPKRYQRITYK